MKQQELSHSEILILANYDVEDLEPLEPRRPVEDSDAHAKLRPMRTICLGDCAIPE
jgi:hypothetical protein